MGIRSFLNKRKREERIRKKGKALYGKKKRRQPSPIESFAGRMNDRGIELGWKIYRGTQVRKGEGRSILIQGFKNLTGGAPGVMRNVLGSSRPKNKKSPSVLRVPRLKRPSTRGIRAPRLKKKRPRATRTRRRTRKP